MKRFSLIVLSVLSLGLNCFAQGKINDHTNKHSNRAPIYILKVAGQADIICHFKHTGFTLATINQTSIKSMEVLKDSTTVKRFGNKGKNGVIQIIMIDNTKIITTNELLKTRNIKKKDQKLPIYIDRVILKYPNEMFYDSSAIKSITVTLDPKTNKKHINIVTVNGRLAISDGYHIRGIIG
jgi:hypothetical protein